MRTGKATYINKVTGETYQLGFEIASAYDTELSRAWDLVSLVALRNGWNTKDIIVQTGWEPC
jgi:hypothetical protein